MSKGFSRQSRPPGTDPPKSHPCHCRLASLHDNVQRCGRIHVRVVQFCRGEKKRGGERPRTIQGKRKERLMLDTAMSSSSSPNSSLGPGSRLDSTRHSITRQHHLAPTCPTSCGLSHIGPRPSHSATLAYAWNQPMPLLLASFLQDPAPLSQNQTRLNTARRGTPAGHAAVCRGANTDSVAGGGAR